LKRADQVSGIVLLALSIFALYESSRLDMAYRGAPGPGFFPFWLSIAMCLISVAIIISGFRRPASSDSRVKWPTGTGLVRILAVFVALVIYVFLIRVIGYILSTAALILCVACMLRRYRWYQLVTVSLLTATGLFVVFHVWLQMPLPTGELIIP
jgi:putative tricarboxylic transport membrane protein